MINEFNIKDIPYDEEIANNSYELFNNSKIERFIINLFTRFQQSLNRYGFTIHDILKIDRKTIGFKCNINNFIKAIKITYEAIEDNDELIDFNNALYYFYDENGDLIVQIQLEFPAERLNPFMPMNIGRVELKNINIPVESSFANSFCMYNAELQFFMLKNINIDVQDNYKNMLDDGDDYVAQNIDLITELILSCCEYDMKNELEIQRIHFESDVRYNN